MTWRYQDDLQPEEIEAIERREEIEADLSGRYDAQGRIEVSRNIAGANLGTDPAREMAEQAAQSAELREQVARNAARREQNHTQGVADSL